MKGDSPDSICQQGPNLFDVQIEDNLFWRLLFDSHIFTWSYSDNTGVKGNDATYVHQVCELFYANCSNKTTTVYGDGGGDDDGEEPNTPPIADFTYSADGLTVQFTDASTDTDGTIES